jgi:hypothetical protein
MGSYIHCTGNRVSFRKVGVLMDDRFSSLPSRNPRNRDDGSIHNKRPQKRQVIKVVLSIVPFLIFIVLVAAIYFTGFYVGYSKGVGDTYEVIKNEKPLSEVLYGGDK